MLNTTDLEADHISAVCACLYLHNIDIHFFIYYRDVNTSAKFSRVEL